MMCFKNFSEIKNLYCLFFQVSLLLRSGGRLPKKLIKTARGISQPLFSPQMHFAIRYFCVCCARQWEISIF
jgi:hypothetical protein